MHNLKGVNFDGYPALDNWDTIFDRLEHATVTKASPFGITVMDFTVEEFNFLKAAFGRNNGYPINPRNKPDISFPDYLDSPITPIKPIKLTLWQRFKRLFH